jgi:hypothetical protein
MHHHASTFVEYFGQSPIIHLIRFTGLNQNIIMENQCPQVLQLPPLQELQDEPPDSPDCPFLAKMKPVISCFTSSPHLGQRTLSLFLILTNSLNR